MVLALRAYDSQRGAQYPSAPADNVITNNVIAYPGVSCTQPNCDSAGLRSSQHAPGSTCCGYLASFNFTRNIILVDHANNTQLYMPWSGGFNNMTMTNNTYWNAANSNVTSWPFYGTSSVGGLYPWTKWHVTMGKDNGSVTADPLFANVSATTPPFLAVNGKDLGRLQAASPAFATGFQPRNFSEAGVRAVPVPFALARSFSDYMVLQRDSPVTVVWGVGTVGVQVVTASTAFTQVLVTTVGLDGVWRQTLPAVAASHTPHNFTFTPSSGEAVKPMKFVTYGDVYVCSGQSNMVRARAPVIADAGG